MKRDELNRNGFRVSRFENITLQQKLGQLFQKLAFFPDSKSLIEEFIPYGQRLTAESSGMKSEGVKIDNVDNNIVKSFGKRKTCKALVQIVKGKGLFYINSIPLDEYFNLIPNRVKVIQPFDTAKLLGKYNVWATVKGGGVTGQTDSIALAVARCIVKIKGKSIKSTFEKGKLKILIRSWN
jgi:ribosomal protein S9